MTTTAMVAMVEYIDLFTADATLHMTFMIELAS